MTAAISHGSRKGDQGRQIARTPEPLACAFVARFGIDLDACAMHESTIVPRFIGPPGYRGVDRVGAVRVAEDAVAAWTLWFLLGKVAFCNPPFRQREAFIDKAIEAHREGMSVAMLMGDDATTGAVRRLLDRGPDLFRFASPDGKASGRFNYIPPEGITYSGSSSGSVVYFLDGKRPPRARGAPLSSFLVHPDTFEIL